MITIAHVAVFALMFLSNVTLTILSLGTGRTFMATLFTFGAVVMFSATRAMFKRYRREMNITRTDHAIEEVLARPYDSGWERNMPTTLITYKDSGHMDLHLQTGPDFEKRLAQAEKLLKERGMMLMPGSKWAYGSSGAYHTVVMQ